jgi:hypothetical protein
MREIIKPDIPFFDDAYAVLNQKRGANRRMSHNHIIIETLRVLREQKPTRDQLQKLSKIRRKRFIAVLKYLIEMGSVRRLGTGTKFDPYLYVLGEKELGR